MEDRDRLRQRQGQVEEQRALPRLPGRLQPQLPLALGGGVRLGGQQPGVDVGGFPAAARRPAQRRAVRGLPLAEQQVIRLPLDHLARLEAEGLRARPPPAAGRLPAALAGLDVIPGRVLRRVAVDLAPDVVQVITLAQGRDNRQTDLCHRGPEAAELTMIIRWCMGVRQSSSHESMVTKRAIKIRNRTRRWTARGLPGRDSEGSACRARQAHTARGSTGHRHPSAKRVRMDW